MSFSTRDKTKYSSVFKLPEWKTLSCGRELQTRISFFTKMPQQGCEAELGALGLCSVASLSDSQRGSKHIRKSRAVKLRSRALKLKPRALKLKPRALQLVQCGNTALLLLKDPCPLLCSAPLTDGERCPSSSENSGVCSVLPPVCSDRLVQAVNTQLLREKRMIKAQTFNFVVFSGGKHTAVKITSKSTVWFLGSGFKTELSTL